MTVTPQLRRHLAGLPGRCPECCWHLPTQGHAPSCSIPSTLGEKGMAETSAAHPADAKRIDTLITTYARSGVEFSANDLRPALTDVKGSLIGARFGAAAKRGLIKRVGYTPSTQAETHGHPIALWRGST